MARELAPKNVHVAHSESRRARFDQRGDPTRRLSAATGSMPDSCAGQPDPDQLHCRSLLGIGTTNRACLVEASETIPSDGEVIEGIASVTRRRSTGEIGTRQSASPAATARP